MRTVRQKLRLTAATYRCAASDADREHLRIRYARQRRAAALVRPEWRETHSMPGISGFMVTRI